MSNGTRAPRYDKVFFEGVAWLDSLATESRLRAHCITCKYRDSRSTFYKSRPEQTPAFVDACPKCRSTDVDIFDPVAEARTREHHRETGVFLEKKRFDKARRMSSDDFWLDEIERIFGVRLDPEDMRMLKGTCEQTDETPVEALRQLVDAAHTDMLAEQTLSRYLALAPLKKL